MVCRMKLDLVSRALAVNAKKLRYEFCIDFYKHGISNLKGTLQDHNSSTGKHLTFIN